MYMNVQGIQGIQGIQDTNGIQDICSSISRDIRLYDGIALPSKSSINIVSCVGIDMDFSKISKHIADYIRNLNRISISISIYPKLDLNADIIFVPEDQIYQISKIDKCTGSVFVICETISKNITSINKTINIYKPKPLSLKVQETGIDLRFLILDRTISDIDMTYILDRIDTDDKKHNLKCIVDLNSKLYHGTRYSSTAYSGTIYSSTTYSKIRIDSNTNAILLLNKTGLDSKIINLISKSLNRDYLLIIDIDRKKLATQLSTIYDTFYKDIDVDLENYSNLIDLYRSKIVYSDIDLSGTRLTKLRSIYNIEDKDLDYVDRHRFMYVDTIDRSNKIHTIELKYLDSNNPMWLGRSNGIETEEAVLGIADEEEDTMRFYRILKTVKYTSKTKREGWPKSSNRKILLLSPVFKVECLADIKYVVNKQSFECMDKIYFDDLDENLF